MPSIKIKTPIEAGKVYHIYNRGNNYQKVFLQPSDYQLFLERLALYLSEYCSIYAYALIPNHYHLLVRVNDDNEKEEFSKQFSKFILSYTNKVNWREKRNGSLFLSYFRRILVEDEVYLKRLVFYIHHNPEKHEIIDDFKNFEYSSFKSTISDKPTRLARSEVLDLFENKEGFINFHKYIHSEYKIKDYIIEDE